MKAVKQKNSGLDIIKVFFDAMNNFDIEKYRIYNFRMIECASNGTAQSYSFDALGRVTLQTETVSGQEFTKSYAYDSYGRVQTENWNTGFGIMYQYNQNGYLSHVKTQNDQLIWQGQAYNARGQLTHYLQGTNLQTHKDYDVFGFLANEYTWGQVDNTYAYNSYDFDEMKGNLMSHTDHLAGGGNGKTESFTYDVLNRLTHGTINSNTLQTVYSNNGNIVLPN